MQGAKKTIQKKKKPTGPDAVNLTEHIGAVLEVEGKTHALCATGMLSWLRRGEPQVSTP